MNTINELQNQMNLSLQRIKEIRDEIIPLQTEMNNEMDKIRECREKILELRNVNK